MKIIIFIMINFILNMYVFYEIKIFIMNNMFYVNKV